MTSTAAASVSTHPTAHYPTVDANPDFVALEHEVLAHWKAGQLFQRSVAQRPAQVNGKSNEFIFYDGPPFANGLPHYGHLLTGYVKDIIARYQTMLGKRVERRFGWDCHGLPAEMGAEKELGISGRAAIIEFGIDKFNHHCRTSVMKYTHDWEYYVTRQARWVDFRDDYKTMDTPFMESVVWAFSELYKKGLVYESMRVMPYSWAAETPVSNFETRIDNATREREDKAAYVKFKLKDKPAGAPDAANYYVIAWTTTPWTLPSNLALAVGKDMSYEIVMDNGDAYISATAFSEKHFPKHHGSMIAKGTGSEEELMVQLREHQKQYPTPVTISGESLLNLSYEPLFPYFAGPALEVANGEVKSARLSMRPFTAADFDLFSALENDPEVTSRMAAGAPSAEVLRAEFDRYISEHAARGYSQWAVFEQETGEFVGRAGFDHRGFGDVDASTLELRYALRSAFWGKGYATEISQTLMAWAAKYTPATAVNAGTFGDNDRSRRVLEKLGFTCDRTVQFKGKEIQYYETTLADWQKRFGRAKHAFRILDGSEFVTEGDGTGIVHMAPGFGEVDQKCCAENGIETLVPVDEKGRFTAEIFDLPDLTLQGLVVVADSRIPADQIVVADADKAQHIDVKDVVKYGLANMRIVRWLKAHGTLVKDEPVKHNYPHCWRTDTPLIYRAMGSWYVNVQAIKANMAANNKTIHWIPDHVQEGQMGRGIESAPDWSISRNRFWGTPIPIWKSPSGKIIVPGSIAEIEQLSGQKVEDLHRPFIDEVTFERDGETYTRIEDVFDCWFESGSMPYAQLHYPFENKEKFEANFPADFITEYIAQTRGWFYTLQVLSAALFECAPFKNVICHGVVIDEETGLKYSKRLKNYKDPKEVMDQYGADALRWMMLASPVMRGSDLGVDPDGKFIRDVVRLNIKPIWNAYNFFTLYANADAVKAKQVTSSENLLDQYILSKARSAVEQVRASLDAYDTPGATEAITGFFDGLNNWYIRRNRDRFWESSAQGVSADKQAAYDTLYTVLVTLCKAAAPLLPMVTEAIYRGLTHEESVHLADFPDVSAFPQDAALVADMDRVRDACTTILSIRSTDNIRVRQPLASATLYGSGAERLKRFASLIADEVNLKEVRFSDALEEAASFKLQVFFPVLGKRLPAAVKQVIPASKAGQWEKLANGNLSIAGVEILPEEFTLLLEPKEKKGAQALSSNDALVVLDLNITDALKAEGYARDLIRAIQEARKTSGFNVSDSIRLKIDANVQSMIEPYASMIAEAVLAKDVVFAGGLSSQFAIEIDGSNASFEVEKV